MKTLRPIGLLPLLAALALGACDDSDPMTLMEDELSFEDEVALQVIADAEAIDAALGLLDVQQNAAGRRRMGGRMGPGASAQIDAVREQARIHLEDARQAFLEGDPMRALERARLGRTLIAEGMQARMGPMAVNGLVERLESLANTAGDGTCFADPLGLGLQLGRLGEAARGAMGRGDHAGAGQLGVLGEQRARQGHREFRGGQGEPDAEYVRVTVELGATAVALATRILAEQGADAEQEEFLAAAVEYQTQAEAALAAGELRDAVYLAGLAEWQALKAVVLPGGITDEEARAMIDLATAQLAAARAAVGDDATELEAGLLLRAAHMLENGQSYVEQGNLRGVGALWRSAVISTWLIG